jgi:hypothetical protein
MKNSSESFGNNVIVITVRLQRVEGKLIPVNSKFTIFLFGAGRGVRIEGQSILHLH